MLDPLVLKYKSRIESHRRHPSAPIQPGLRAGFRKILGEPASERLMWVYDGQNNEFVSLHIHAIPIDWGDGTLSADANAKIGTAEMSTGRGLHQRRSGRIVAISVLSDVDDTVPTNDCSIEVLVNDAVKISINWDGTNPYLDSIIDIPFDAYDRIRVQYVHGTVGPTGLMGILETRWRRS